MCCCLSAELMAFFGCHLISGETVKIIGANGNFLVHLRTVFHHI